ncbi:MAG: hypothetical protein Tsb0013_12420 [Phycisphaerales bacterium]
MRARFAPYADSGGFVIARFPCFEVIAAFVTGRLRDMLMRQAFIATTLLALAGTAHADPPYDGAGNPGDTYYIPPGYFAPGVPAVGTLAQQQMMAEAVEQMWALGEAQRQDVIDLGAMAIADLDAYLSTDPAGWDLYDYAVELETMVEDAAYDAQQTIAGSVVPIFGAVESSLPAPPTELLTAAFGPTLTSISLVWVEADYAMMELASRRPAVRPPEPAPPVVAFAVPEVAVQVDEPDEQSQPQVEQAPDSAPSDVDLPAWMDRGASDREQGASGEMTAQERKQVERLEKQIARTEAKLDRLEQKFEAKSEAMRARVERVERRASERLERERAKLASLDGADEKQAQRVRAKIAKLEQKYERVLEKQRQKLEQAEARNEQKLELQRIKLENMDAKRASLAGEEGGMGT